MNNNFGKKGITLIALIITIIVLLILAGVSMSFIVGDNGVVSQAQKARKRSDETSAKEEIDIEVAGSYNEEGYLDLDLLNANLRNNLDGIKLKKKGTTGDNEDDFDSFSDDNKIESLPATVKYKGVNVKINEKQLISNVAKDVENYGMYVDYPIDLDGDKETSDWKIFYEDETGRVFLIAADYVPNSNAELKTAQGITGSETTGKEKAKMTPTTSSGYNLCCSYWANAGDAEYHCYDGISETNHENGKQQCSFPEIFMLAGKNNVDEHTNNHYYCSKHTTNTNSKCASALQCTGNWSSFVNSSYADYAIGGPTLEMWVSSWNQKYGKEKCENGITLFANGNNDDTGKRGYCVGDSAGCEDTYKYITGCDKGWSDKLYFPHKNQSSNLNLFEENESSGGTSESASCVGYWLASPSANTSSNCLMYVYYYGNVSHHNYDFSGVGVRPVVSLQSGVYVEVQEDVKKGDNVIKSCTLVK